MEFFGVDFEGKVKIAFEEKRGCFFLMEKTNFIKTKI